MKLRGPRVRALACLLLWSNVVAAGLIDPLFLKRDTPATTTATTAAAAASTTAADAATSATQSTDTTAKTDATTTTAETTEKSTSTTATATAKTTQKTTSSSTSSTHTTSSTASSTVSSTSAVPTLTSNGTSLNETIFNTTIAAGELPLTPELTPGWAVAGIIMILTGAVYTLIGIKKRFLHTFFSTAFLTSLGTAVLIVYVMTPPVKNAVQGGFVVACVCTGLILGGVGIIFKDITEGLGCLLGGFTFGMWLMCLHEGGLMQSTTGKIIFIVVFSVGGFAFYFTHWTRYYALIVSIAFAGATVTVLGIDAFSRAGLKEFWAYIWDLNDNLFPLGATTYPLTRGIRVELAVTIILFLAGIISQLKLWRVVQERRAKREAEEAVEEAKRQAEEEALGRKLEAANARDRQEWEAVYGDGTVPPRRSSENDSTPDSGVGDMDSEKKVMHAQSRAVPTDKNGEVVEGADGEQIELAEMPANEDAPGADQAKGAAQTVMEHNEEDGVVTVRVAQDEFPNGPPPDATAHNEGTPRRLSKEAAAAAGVSAHAPDIVPLPFRVPVGHGEEEGAEKAYGDDDRSSVATFADEEDAVRDHRQSIAKRLSQGSADVFRSLSQRSKRHSANLENRNAQLGESSEGLVTPHSIRFVHNGDNESIAATVDGMSSDDDDDSVRGGRNNKHESKSIEVKAELAERSGSASRDKGMKAVAAGAAAAAGGAIVAAVASKKKDTTVLLSPPPKKNAEVRPVSAETVNTEILDMPPSPAERTDSTELIAKTANSEFSVDDGEPAANPVADEAAVESRKGKSVVSVDSTPASLTRERLPRSLSRIAMSYRTNEWAKHLSNAETPEPETLQLDDYLQQPDSPSVYSHMESEADAPIHNETPAPINVAELTQTAATGAPPPAAPRSVSASASYSNLQSQPNPAAIPPQTLSRSNSRQSITVQDVAPAAAARNTFMSGFRSMSSSHIGRRASVLRNEPIAEESEVPEAETAARTAADLAEPPQSPFEDSASLKAGAEAANMSTNTAPVPGVVSYSSPQTLIGQREMLLRSKSMTGSYIGGPVVTSASMGSLTSMPSMPTLPTMPTMTAIPSAPASESGSVYNYQPAAANSNVDLDDLPMSARRNLMRQSSQMSMGGYGSTGLGLGTIEGSRVSTMSGVQPLSTQNLPQTTAGSANFDSHQPKRGLQHLPTSAIRQAQLATFRNSVAHELRAGVPVVQAGNNHGLRESMSQPYLSAAAAGMNINGSSASLRAPSPYSGGREHEVQQSINLGRSYLMNQKEAEVQKREMERIEKERTDRAFEERMRRGDLLDAHREAMRRMQASAKSS